MNSKTSGGHGKLAKGALHLEIYLGISEKTLRFPTHTSREYEKILEHRSFSKVLQEEEGRSERGLQPSINTTLRRVINQFPLKMV